MPTDFLFNIPQIILTLRLSVIFKVFLLLFLSFYAVLAIITLRQVQIMANTLVTPLSAILKFFAILNLGASLAIILVTGGFI